MSKILDLAEDFERKSREQAGVIESNLKSEFERHEQFIKRELRSNEQRITDDINAQSERLSSLVLKTWIWLPVTVITVLLACWGVIWWQGMTIVQNQQEIKRQEIALEELNAKTWGVSLYQDEEGNYLVIPEGYKVRGGWTLNDGKNELIKLVEK